MSEGRNQLDEGWEEVPEPEEITEEEARELPVALDPESWADDLESEAADLAEAGLDDIAEAIAEAAPILGPPNRPPDMLVKLRGAPFGSRPHHPPNLRVPVFFEQNHIPTIAHSKLVVRPGGQARWFVRINSKRLRDKGATPKGIELTIAHEVQGHCRGFTHREGNPQVNPAFNPVVNIFAT